MFEKIFDLQDNIIIITDLQKVVNANRAFFRFFSEYDNVEEFNKSINDIADIFVPLNEFGFIYKDIEKEPWNSKNFTWYEYVIFNAHKACRVSIKNSIFNIRVSIVNEKEYIINLSDITELVVFKNNLLEELESKNEELYKINSSLEGKLQEQVNELQRLNKELSTKVNKHEIDSAKIERNLINESKIELTSQMINMMAHQWRQPLTAINAYNQSIKLKKQKGKLNNDHLDKATDEIKNLVHSLDNNIKDFQDFFRHDNKKDKVSLNSVINRALSLISYAMSQNSIDIIFHQDIDIDLTIYANKLMQVFLEVLQNCEDVLIERKIESAKIEIKTIIENNFAIITIKDNGGGVDENIKNKIFEPYFSKKKNADRGMGLYMVKKILENSLAGEITVDNDLDGAIVSIKLPITLKNSEIETTVETSINEHTEEEFGELFENFNDSIENIQISKKINILDLFVIIEFLVWYEEFLKTYSNLSHFRTTIANFINYLKIYDNPEKLDKLETNREELFNILISMGDDLRNLYIKLSNNEDIYNLDNSLVSTFHQLFVILNKKDTTQRIEFF
jgi:signal transduction histidine kinase